MRFAVDSSVLVALINPRDVWHKQAMALRQMLLNTNAELLYFDCVAAEAISVVVRRLHEKGQTAEVQIFLDHLESHIPHASLTWILPDVPRLYSEVLNLIRSSAGELNFNDALIALACRERKISAIVSFDADFDQVPWLKRLADPADSG